MQDIKDLDLKCVHCDGTGKVLIETEQVDCDECGGSGEMCYDCYEPRLKCGCNPGGH